MVFIERTGCIYKITNLKNGKVYIGQTVQSPPIKRWIDHYKTAKSNTNSNKLYEDLCKQGIVDFSFQIISQINAEIATMFIISKNCRFPCRR